MITIPSNTTIIGEFRSSGRVCFQGNFEGKADIDGMLVITHTAVWKGRVCADRVVIEGNIEGDVIARQVVEIGPNAVINGTVTSPKISIDQGGKINGKMNMQAPDPIGLLDWKKEESITQPTDTEPMVKTG